ncbi:hypothetical protein [Caballeronia zhejiangensis]|uniref:hypothetical protein n=1 Tax=Caballeronia zhejiangensis TaxID=871203 RepID=UPI00158EB630|nr:hypothetical protein [Caballeronia zhejiangensis]
MMPGHFEEIDAAIQTAIDALGTSQWLREALVSALRRDCVDASRDAQTLAVLLGRRCDVIVRKARG